MASLSAGDGSSLASDEGFDGINIQRILSYCPIYREDNIDLYSYDLLVLCLLIVNSFFLFWIMGVRSKSCLCWSSVLILRLSSPSYDLKPPWTMTGNTWKQPRPSWLSFLCLASLTFWLSLDLMRRVSIFTIFSYVLCPERVSPGLHNFPVLPSNIPLYDRTGHHSAVLLL